jgi:DNA mismatch repair protein MutL
MSVTDARLCFERHDIKIRQAEDLFSLHKRISVHSASIAAIAHVEMKTKQDQEELGATKTHKMDNFPLSTVYNWLNQPD